MMMKTGEGEGVLEGRKGIFLTPSQPGHLPTKIPSTGF